MRFALPALVLSFSIVGLLVAQSSTVPAKAKDESAKAAGAPASKPPEKAPAGQSKPPEPAKAEGQLPKTEKSANRFSPTSRPERLVLTLLEHPQSRMGLSWRTDATVSTGLVQVGPALDSGYAMKTHAEKGTGGFRSLKARTETVEAGGEKANYHKVAIEELEPGRLYAYRAGDGRNWSEWHQFRPARTGSRPFRFVYFGDAQNDVLDLWSRVIRQADRFRPDFMIHAGDLVNRGENDSDWGEWHAAGGWIHATVPGLPTPGNHEYSGAISLPGMARRARLTPHWNAQFNLPANGAPGLEGTCYYLDYQNTRFISLNTNEKDRFEAQAAWLDSVLGANHCRWTIVTFHHPVYSSARKRDNAEVRSFFRPVIEKYKVDLVLQGHDHSYGRSGLMAGAESADGSDAADRGDTVYVVSVSGPKMYDVDDRAWMDVRGDQTQLFQVIDVSADAIKYEAHTATGVRFDAFEIRREGGRNRLVQPGERPSSESSAPVLWLAAALVVLVPAGLLAFRASRNQLA